MLLRTSLLLALTTALVAQTTPKLMTGPERAAAAGDVTTTITAPARLSPALHKKDVAKALRLVADWQLAYARPHFNQDWTYAPLYDGFMTLPLAVNGKKYQDAMLAFGKETQYRMGPDINNSNDQAVGRTYARLYLQHHDPAMIAPAIERAQHVMQHVDDPSKLLWHWCDALFMGPPTFTQLYLVTHDNAYIDFMDKEWWQVSNELYSPEYHLYFRDKSYIPKREANGKPVFWSRGDGWVIAALAQVITDLPAGYPSRPRYIQQFQEMAAALAALQGTDGLWRAALLDPETYPLPEVSGSAFNIYAIAWGINHGFLDRATYTPIVTRGWAGLLSHIYTDGRLGSIQPIGQSPGKYPETSSYVYGVGAFLLAGSEVYNLSK